MSIIKNGSKKKVPAYRQAMNQENSKSKKQNSNIKTTKSPTKKVQSKKSTTVSKVSNIPKKTGTDVKKFKKRKNF